LLDLGKRRWCRGKGTIDRTEQDLLRGSTGRQIAAWAAHDAAITALAFHPGGHLLCSGDKQGAIKLWDLRMIRHDLAQMGLPWD